jgi:Zn-dependent M28 family amino/carboxypeptidase
VAATSTALIKCPAKSLQQINMQKKLFTLLFTGMSAVAFAQPGAPDQFAGSITKDDLKKQLTIIAGPEMEGRETGTEGQRKAAAYIVTQFKAFGLLPAPGTDNYQQYYSIGYDTLLQSQLMVNKTTLVSGKDYVDEIGSNKDGAVKAKQLVFTGYGIGDEKYDDYAGKDVKGKIVVFFSGEPKKDGSYFISGSKQYSSWTYPGGLSQKLELAKTKGAVGAIIIEARLDSITANYARFAKKSSTRLIPTQDPAGINAFIIAGGRANTILGDAFFAAVLPKAKKNELLNTENFSKKIAVNYVYKEEKVNTQASNIAGYIEGTDRKDEYVVLTAHYDHLGMRNGQIYYGADDDGSGTCAVIEMAEAFAKAKAAGMGPRRTIVFMTVSGEEKGLWGSEYYSDNPLFPLEKTSVDLNTDMIGRIDTERKTADSLNYVYVIGHNKLSSDLVGINEDANTKYSGLVLDYKFDDVNDPNRIYYRSDHYNFARKGIPILFFYDGMLQADYHKPTDTVDKIYWDIYEKRARMIFNTAWQMANRDDMLKRDIPLN